MTSYKQCWRMVEIRALARGLVMQPARHDMDLMIYRNSSRDDESARFKRIAERQQADGIMLAGTLKQE